MSLRNSLKSFVDRLSFSESETPEVAGTSGMSTLVDVAGTSSGYHPEEATTSSAFSDAPEVSQSNRSSMRKSVKEKGHRTSRVLRSSVVEPHFDVMPPLSSLAPGEDTARKLARVLEKFNSIDLTEDSTSTPERNVGPENATC
uniref:Uncharacterized protein n=1 Tax=Graphocephala atropunctata TaxID=36148 RepID=A0A1B6MLN2_9HEMI